jgi:hypothetical protein
MSPEERCRGAQEQQAALLAATATASSSKRGEGHSMLAAGSQEVQQLALQLLDEDRLLLEGLQDRTSPEEHCRAAQRQQTSLSVGDNSDSKGVTELFV